MADILLKIPTHSATLASGIQEERLFEAKAGRLALGFQGGSILNDNFDNIGNHYFPSSDSVGGDVGYAKIIDNVLEAKGEAGRYSGKMYSLGASDILACARMKLTVKGNYDYGIILRTTEGNLVGGYRAVFYGSSLKFVLFAGSSSLGQSTMTFTVGTWYRLHLSCIGTSVVFKIYSDSGSLLETISATNATYSGTWGGITAGYWTTTGQTDWIKFGAAAEALIDNPYNSVSPTATLMKIGAGTGIKFKLFGSELWIPENVSISGSPQAPKYQYAKLTAYGDTPTYNGTWLTQAQFRTAIGERTDTIEALMIKAQFNSSGDVSCSIDDGFIPAEMVGGVSVSVIIIEDGVMA